MMWWNSFPILRAPRISLAPQSILLEIFYREHVPIQPMYREFVPKEVASVDSTNADSLKQRQSLVQLGPLIAAQWP